MYLHGVMRQGHTHRGQLLGADVGVGAASGATLRWNSYRRRGYSSLSAQRIVRQECGTFHVDGMQDPRSVDVQYALEAVRRLDFQRVQWTGKLALIRGFNRNFREDATSVSAVLGARIRLGR